MIWTDYVMIVIGVLFVIGLLVLVAWAFWVAMTDPGDDDTEKHTRETLHAINRMNRK